MSLAVLEKIRLLCSDIELRRLAVADCTAACEKKQHQQPQQQNAKPMHDAIALVRDHFTLRQSDEVRKASDSILDTLDGPEMERLAELYSMFHATAASSSSSSSANGDKPAMASVVASFDLEAANLREYHRLHPQKPFELPQMERPSYRDVHHVRDIIFTGPERKGRSVDLSAAYRSFSEFLVQSAADLDQQSSRIVTRDIDVTYADFVADPVGACNKIVPNRKVFSSAQPTFELYRRCLTQVIESLESFVTKTRPLHAEAELADVNSKVAAVVASAASSSAKSAPLRLAVFAQPIQDGWKELAASNWSQYKRADDATRQRVTELLHLEEKIALLCESAVGESVLAASREHILRAALRTPAENAQDREDDELAFQQDFFPMFCVNKPLSDAVGLTVTDMNAAMMAAGPPNLKQQQLQQQQHQQHQLHEDDDDDDGRERTAQELNLKNFPLDALGNPIPPWLYKLHGLDKKFHCEVCGFSYAGEKAYTQHFKEARHESGLERLGIKITPYNADAFRLISTRDGALAAQRRLTEGEQNARRRHRGDDVEVEDATGNVATAAQLRDVRF